MKFSETQQYRVMVAQLAVTMLSGAVMEVYKHSSDPDNLPRRSDLCRMAVAYAEEILKQAGANE